MSEESLPQGFSRHPLAWLAAYFIFGIIVRHFFETGFVAPLVVSIGLAMLAISWRTSARLALPVTFVLLGIVAQLHIAARFAQLDHDQFGELIAVWGAKEKIEPTHDDAPLAATLTHISGCRRFPRRPPRGLLPRCCRALACLAQS